MRLIEKKLKNEINKIEVGWDGLEKDTELKRFLLDNSNVKWINSNNEKITYNTMTISDRSITINRY